MHTRAQKTITRGDYDYMKRAQAPGIAMTSTSVWVSEMRAVILLIDGSEIRRSPVEARSLSHYLRRVLYIQKMVSRISEPSAVWISTDVKDPLQVQRSIFTGGQAYLAKWNNISPT